MKINVQFLPERNEIADVEVADGAMCLAVLEKLNLSPDAHIVTREGDPIPIDEKLKDGEKIEIIKVVSGG
jgi:sulfur carrier protein ThiS